MLLCNQKENILAFVEALQFTTSSNNNKSLNSIELASNYGKMYGIYNLIGLNLTPH